MTLQESRFSHGSLHRLKTARLRRITYGLRSLHRS
jgi:hypothetical protein